MIGRFLALLVVVWAFGFLWFAVALPRPAPLSQTDAIVVPTGGPGRIPRGIEMLDREAAPRLLVSGVFEDVTPAEFSAEYQVPHHLMACCITLDFAALDTRGNARETAEWVKAENIGSIRLVTSDWHMRRAVAELRASLPDDITILPDAVGTEPSLWILFLEYHKFLATSFIQNWPG